MTRASHIAAPARTAPCDSCPERDRCPVAALGLAPLNCPRADAQHPASIAVFADAKRALALAQRYRGLHVQAYETSWAAVDRLRDMADKAGLAPRLTARHAQALCLTNQQ